MTMRPQLPLLRALARPVNGRTTLLRMFTQRSAAPGSSRPIVPFLGIPSSYQIQLRNITTDRGRRLRYSIILTIKYTTYFFLMLGCVLVLKFAILQEMEEREHPTPPEWTFFSRCAYRDAETERNRKDVPKPDLVKVIQLLQYVLDRLEMWNKDGEDVRTFQTHPAQPKDISHKSEVWRRAYFNLLLQIAQLSEHVEGWVHDKTRDIVFPPNVVIGPSNPRPRPIMPGSAAAPLENNCEPFFASPAVLYEKLINTKGLAQYQQLAAGIAYANWLEIKGDLEKAEFLLEGAIEVATGETIADVPDYVRKWTKDESRRRSANLLDALTAYATFKARRGDIQNSVPLVVALLNTRRSLPRVPPVTLAEKRAKAETDKVLARVMGMLRQPEYPPPPPDGTAPPFRDDRSRCEEAALNMYIGELMFAHSKSAKNRERGVGWMRDAVDLSADLLRDMQGKEAPDQLAKVKCRQCLSESLITWSKMAQQLSSQEEEEAKKEEEAAQQRWTSLWGPSKTQSQGRWAAEGKLVKQWATRTKPLMEEPVPPLTLWDHVLQILTLGS